MELSEKKAGKVTVLTLDGRLDASSATDFKDTIKRLIDNNQKFLVIDMKDVTFVDSTGLGGLISCLRNINKANGEIKISSLRDDVRAIFELTRLHSLFEIFHDEQTAVAHFED